MASKRRRSRESETRRENLVIYLAAVFVFAMVALATYYAIVR